MSRTTSDPVLRVGSFEVDPASGEVRRGDEVRRLQPQPLALLLALAESPGQVVSREDLRRKLWPDTAVGFEDSLNHAVARLREVLREGEGPTLIETVPRAGYRLAGEVGREPAVTAPVTATEGAEPGPPAAATGAAPARRAGGKRLAWVAAALVAALAVGTLAWQVWPRERREPEIRGIAVLPLANLSADRDQDYLADGITEELITELARCASLRVLSRTSTLRYRGSTKSVPQIARELGVDAVVEGSIQRDGDRLRVAAQLIRASPEAHLGAWSYDLEIDDVLALRSRVAGEIVRELGLKLPTRAGAPHDVPAAAHDAFLLGRSFVNRATREGYEKAIEYLDRAVALDDRYALAYAELAEAHAMLDFLDDRRGSHFEKARELARRAVELAPEMGEARLREADLRFYWDWDWSQCESGFRVARDLSPGSADTRGHYAVCLVRIGRYDDALRESGRALEVDPFSVLVRQVRAELLSRAGRRAEAIDELRKVADLTPADAQARRDLASVLLDAGRGEEALAAFAAASRLGHEPAEKANALGEALQRGGGTALLEEARSQERERLERRLAELEARSRTERVSPVTLAAVHADLGNLDRAFELLDEAFRERSPRLTSIRGSRRWAPLRGDPRYAGLLRRMRLPED